MEKEKQTQFYLKQVKRKKKLNRSGKVTKDFKCISEQA